MTDIDLRIGLAHELRHEMLVYEREVFGEEYVNASRKEMHRLNQVVYLEEAEHMPSYNVLFFTGMQIPRAPAKLQILACGADRITPPTMLANGPAAVTFQFDDLTSGYSD